MTKEEMKIYADKYRKTQTKLSLGMSIFVFIIAVILTVAAVLLMIYADGSYIIYTVGGIMLILAIVDTFVGVKFIGLSKTKFKTMKDKEAAERYCKIHGFDTRIEKEKRDE